MAADINCKVYFQKGNGSTEIRRFEMAACNVRNYLVLKKIIKDIFDLKDEDIALSWQDADGDKILISSNGELSTAIDACAPKGLSNCTLLRLFISLKEKKNKESPKKENSNEETDQLHYYVVCDGCEGSIYGNRYKCQTCPDFDLCENCKSRGKHNHHNMTTISKAKFGKPNASFQRNKDGSSSVHVDVDFGQIGGGVFGPFGPHTKPPPPPPFHFGGFGGFPKNHSFRRRGCPFQHHPPSPPPPPPPPHAFSFPWPTFSESPAAEGAAKAPSDTTDKIAADAGKIAAQLAGQHLSAIMKDMWTAYSEHFPERAAATATESAKTPEAAKDQETDDSGESVNSVSPTREAVAETQEEDEMMEVSAEETPRPESREDWTLLNKAEGNNPESDNDGNEAIACPVVYPDVAALISETSVDDDTAPSGKGMGVEEPPPDVAPAETPNPDKKIRIALDQMRAMGYSNDGGWLTRLLEMKNGNINDVLDLLMPASNR